MGWVGSAALRARLGSTPCGCAILDDARRQLDPRGRETLAEDGERYRTAWHCPFAKTASTEPLTPAHLTAVRAVSELIGGTLPLACPCSHARTPDAHRVSKLKQWRDKGQLQLVCPRPPLTIVQAIDALSEGCTDREAHEYEEAQRKAEETLRGGRRG